jgi:glycolate oxidase iron-sulfur subunit
MLDIIEDLKKYEEMVMRCMKCGSCHANCPLYKNDKKEGSVARGKLALIEAAYDSRLENITDVMKYLDYCILCGRCETGCPSGVQTNKIYVQVKSVLRKLKKLSAFQRMILYTIMEKPELTEKLLPMVSAGLKTCSKKVKDNLYKPFLNPSPVMTVPEVSGKSFIKKHGGFHKAYDEKMRVIFYPGCAINMMYTDWGEAVIEVLASQGVSVYVPEKNICCGIPSATMGNMDTFVKNNKKNIEYFNSIDDAEYIITACPTCENGLFELGTALSGMGLDKKHMDIMVFIKDVLKLKLQPAVTERAGLHLPCHYSASKKGELVSFMKDELAHEYQDLAKADSCCGFGGTFKMKHYEASKEVPREKIQEIKDKNIDKLYAPCPGCTMQLSDIAFTNGVDVVVEHPIMAVLQSLQK